MAFPNKTGLWSIGAMPSGAGGRRQIGLQAGGKANRAFQTNPISSSRWRRSGERASLVVRWFLTHVPRLRVPTLCV
jgi:hypothetical protein